jgi:SAM-dependent methyltransferase
MPSPSTNETEASPKVKALDNVEHEVLRRYGNSAESVEPELCCPVDYDPRYLEVIPAEIIEKDYGCGDPSRHVRCCETVLDLGSGTGKICYILSQKVGKKGRVIGVDFNDKMLALAHKHQDEISDKIGYRNVEFKKGKIQDLGLNLDRVQTWLDRHPVHTVDGLHAFEAECARLRREEPLIADNSVDVIVSNCVLNLVKTEEKGRLFAEMFRVLRPGGRAVISDIVCDEDPSDRILADPELWSGCISGAFREDRFPGMFQETGFYGISILERKEDPWQVIDGVEFRSVTVCAYKPDSQRDLELNQAVIFHGPWMEVKDEQGNILRRGERTAVGGATYQRLTESNGPYQGSVTGIPPNRTVDPGSATEFRNNGGHQRHPKDSKSRDYNLTLPGNDLGKCC